MICDVCKTHPATVYLTQNCRREHEEDQSVASHVQKEKGVSDPTGFCAWPDLLLGMGETHQVEQARHRPKHCPGMRIYANGFLRKLAVLGAAIAMRLLTKSSFSLIKAMHQGTQHTGKVPTRYSRNVARTDRLNELCGGAFGRSSLKRGL